jgi:hypothetical protein
LVLLSCIHTVPIHSTRRNITVEILSHKSYLSFF